MRKFIRLLTLFHNSYLWELKTDTQAKNNS